MKKKLLTLVALMVIVIAPTFANNLFSQSSDLSVGVGLGTNNGVAAKYKIDKDWTVGAVVGVGTSGFTVDAVGLMNVSQFEIEKEKFDVNAGGGLAMSFGGGFGLAALGAVEVTHSFKGDLPIDVLLRLEPGLAILPSVGFTMQATIQGLWRLDI